MAEVTPFGALGDGRKVHAIDLRNGTLSARVLDYGARLVLYRRGSGPNISVAGTLPDYENEKRYFGPIIAPVINRIAGARAEIDGRRCTFDANQDGRHTLHSGRAGSHTAIWAVSASDAAFATFTLDLADGAGGFPGNRRITARYALEDDGLSLDIEATTDAPTLMNPGSHGVWNPDGAPDWSRLSLTVPSERFLPTTPEDLPTGEIASVAGTLYDHRGPRPPDSSLDHNYCFEPHFGLRARLEGDRGVLEVHSDAPGLQAYAGGREGIALEPQLWPDAPNNPQFPSIRLAAGETFRQRSRFLIVA
ncbi:MAG: galactose mutarotase [Paracoccaceae bacterium]|nr:galactose mutarotase [Paracoccaceae bacterium]